MRKLQQTDKLQDRQLMLCSSGICSTVWSGSGGAGSMKASLSFYVWKLEQTFAQMSNAVLQSLRFGWARSFSHTLIHF